MQLFYPLEWLADRLTFDVLRIAEGSRLGDAVSFFLYDVPKILLLLTVIVFAVSLVRSFFPPEKTRTYLARLPLVGSHFAAAGIGVMTPFCSCSAVPLFIGFIESGVPLGVTFSFLIASPMVDAVALGLLAGLFGFEIAAIYLVAGVTVAVVGGMVIGRLGLESHVEEYVYKIRMAEVELEQPSWRQRFEYARTHVGDILRRVWPFVVAAIAIGGFMHGYLPADFIGRYAGPANPFAVPAAVLLGVPLYANVAGALPIASVLVQKGVAMGTVLAFLMAVVALSLPEMIILRKVLKPRLIAVFVGINFAAITAIGYLFNWLIPRLT